MVQDGRPPSERSSIDLLDKFDSSSESHHMLDSSSLAAEDSPNNCVASNSALTGSSSISNKNRGVSGMANRNNKAITPGTTPMPMIHLHIMSTVRGRSSLPDFLEMLTTINERTLPAIWPRGCMKNTAAIILARCLVGANLQGSAQELASNQAEQATKQASKARTSIANHTTPLSKKEQNKTSTTRTVDTSFQNRAARTARHLSPRQNRQTDRKKGLTQQ